MSSVHFKSYFKFILSTILIDYINSPQIRVSVSPTK